MLTSCTAPLGDNLFLHEGCLQLWQHIGGQHFNHAVTVAVLGLSSYTYD